jgi:uncharacterized protein
MTTSYTAPDRILSLDILRGFAVLGILIMNMIAFSMVSANYTNPWAEGPLTGADLYWFYFTQLFANQKFMSIFSILFGAGVVLMAEKLEAISKRSAKRHYLRNFWLLVLGMIHAYVFWFGDILVAYALCSIWVYLFRKKTVKTLFIWAGALLFIEWGLTLFFGTSMSFWPPESLEALCESYLPTREAMDAEIEGYRGSWSEQFPYRKSMAMVLQTTVFFTQFMWRVTALMLIGMALYKSGVIVGKKAKRFYTKLFIIGFSLGIVLGVVGLIQNTMHHWECTYSFFQGTLFNSIGSVPMALSYIALVMLASYGRWKSVLEKWIAPVGRMALTNYLMQTLIATTLFYGHGFGLFGSASRSEHWMYIVPIWIFQILFSRWWLETFKFGPMEWLWRSLTYMQILPIRKDRIAQH